MRPSDDQLTAWMRAVFAGRASSETIAAISEEVRRARAAEVDALGRLAHASQELHQRSGHDGIWAECPAASCAGDRELVGAGHRNADRRALADIRHAITKAEEAVARSRMPGWTPRTVGEACGHHLSELRGLREVERRIIGDPNFHAGPHPAAPGACARCDVLESASAPTPTEPRCAGCQRSIDPATCWCGSPVDGHGYGDGHSAVPMGCECHRRGPSERETP